MNRVFGLLFMVFFLSINSYCIPENQLVIMSIDPVLGIYTGKTIYSFDESGMINEIQYYCRDIENWHDYSIEELKQISLNKIYKKEKIIIGDNVIYQYIYNYDAGTEKQLKRMSFSGDNLAVEEFNGKKQLISIDNHDSRFIVYNDEGDNNLTKNFEVIINKSLITCISEEYKYEYVFIIDNDNNIIQQKITQKDQIWENRITTDNYLTFIQYFYSSDYSTPAGIIEISGRVDGASLLSSAINTMILKGSQMSWLLPFVVSK